MQTSMRFDDGVADRIRVFADKYGINLTDLVRLWAGQRLAEEEMRLEHQHKLHQLQLAQLEKEQNSR